VGSETSGFHIGDCVGVPWLGYTCGVCKYCRSGQENLCDEARFTGYHINGGFAEYTVADHRFCFHIPETFSAIYAAPLLCAGLIGYRAYNMIRSAKTIGLYGFGSAAHIVIQIARWEGKRVFAFVRPGDEKTKEFAKKMGAVWADYTDEYPPEEMDASIIFAPAGELIPSALAAVAKGGTVVCGGIYMSDIPSFAYDLIWGERSIKTVANLTREDGEALFKIAPLIPVQCEVTTFPLEQANEALMALKQGSFNGSGVIVVDQ
jgi:propanol-preferring alcohol dehydrogenase